MIIVDHIFYNHMIVHRFSLQVTVRYNRWAVSIPLNIVVAL